MLTWWEKHQKKIHVISNDLDAEDTIQLISSLALSLEITLINDIVKVREEMLAKFDNYEDMTIVVYIST